MQSQSSNKPTLSAIHKKRKSMKTKMRAGRLKIAKQEKSFYLATKRELGDEIYFWRARIPFDGWQMSMQNAIE